MRTKHNPTLICGFLWNGRKLDDPGQAFLHEIFGLIVTIFTIVVTLVILLQSDFDNGKTPCPNCTWLSCVPFPPWENESDRWWYCDDCGRVTAELITKPSLQLELACPSGASATVPLTDTSVSRQRLQRDLPRYCREYCLHTKQHDSGWN